MFTNIDEIQKFSKDRMDLFLRDHPELFEKYALTDAVIPAKWVARTYSLLLERLGPFGRSLGWRHNTDAEMLENIVDEMNRNTCDMIRRPKRGAPRYKRATCVSSAWRTTARGGA